MQIKQWVRTRKLNKAATTPQSTSSESIEMIDNEENIDPIPSISEDNEHNQDEQGEKFLNLFKKFFYILKLCLSKPLLEKKSK